MTIEYDEKGKRFTDIVTERPIYATVQTTKHLMRGNIHVRRDQRIKDELEPGREIHRRYGCQHPGSG